MEPTAGMFRVAMLLPHHQLYRGNADTEHLVASETDAAEQASHNQQGAEQAESEFPDDLEGPSIQ